MTRGGLRETFLGPPLLLIVGDGPTKWDDLEAFWELCPPSYATCCLNRVGLVYPCLFEYWWSVHPEELVAWSRDNTSARLWSFRPATGVSVVHVDSTGGSALSAVMASPSWGARLVVLAGVPLSGPYKDQFERSWRNVSRLLCGHAKSMSGFTMKLLGYPTKKWLQNIPMGPFMPPKKVSVATTKKTKEVCTQQTIQMTRDKEKYPAPHTANVHPEEVDNWKQHGWIV